MEELRPDLTPILTLPPDDPPEELNEIEEKIKQQKIKVHKAKVIALDRLGHHPITTDLKTFNKRSKNQILELIKDIYDQPDDVVQKEFDEICNETIFGNENGKDYTTYPVFKKSYKIG